MEVTSAFDGGGGERVALSLVQALSKKGVTVRGVALHNPTVRIGAEWNDTLHQNCEFLGKSPGIDVRIFSRLLNAIVRFRPDVLHSHLSVLKYVFPLAIRAGRIPIVHTVHSIATFDATGTTRLANALAFHSGRVVPVGVAGAVGESVKRLYRLGSCHVIHNGVNGALPSASPAAWRARHRIGPQSIVFLWVGSLRAPKSPLRVLEAFAHTARHRTDVELVFLGDGPLRHDLSRSIENLGLPDRVHLLGFCPEVPEAIAASDVLVHCSNLEGDPVAIKEAMIAGLPVIAASVGGIPESVSDGVTGALYAPQDTSRLAALIQMFARNAEFRQTAGSAAMTLARSRFTAEVMADAYIDLFDRIHRSSEPGLARTPGVMNATC